MGGPGRLPLLFSVGLGVLVLASCKTPTRASGSAKNQIHATTAPAESPRGSMPQFEQGSSATEEAIEQINQFLLDEQAELAKLREDASDEIHTSDNTAPRATPPDDPVRNVSLSSATASVKTDPSTSVAVTTTESIAVEPSGVEVVTREVTDRADLDVLTPWIRSLMESAAQSDAPMRQHLALAIVLALSAPEQTFQPAGLSELTDEEQELLRIVYERFRLLREELDEGGDASSSLQTAFAELITSVEAENPFQISRMQFCSWVRDFGDVDVIDPPTFAPKERPRFIWYIELAGVQPVEETDTGSWFYEFSVRLEVLTRDTGVPVIAPIEGKVRHASSSRVRDLFLRDIFEMPSDLQFDWYTVKLTVTDSRSGAQAQKGVDLLWVPNLAAGAALMDRQATANTEK